MPSGDEIPTLRLVARGVIVRADAVLVARAPWSTGYFLPGGGVDLDETPSEAVVREIREELGLDSVIRADLGSYLNSWRRNGKELAERNFVFAIDLLGDRPTITSMQPSLEFSWLPLVLVRHAPIQPPVMISVIQSWIATVG